MEATQNKELMRIFSGQVREIPENAEESRTIPFIISDESKDRHGTRLKMDNWVLEHFNDNPIIGYQHDVYGGGMCLKADPDDVIGYGRAYAQMVDGEMKLLCDVTFEPKEINEKADKIFRKVMHGSIRATSVGFRPIGGGVLVDDETGKEERLEEYPNRIPKGKTFIPDGQELVELSIVNIPSNRNALKRSLRNQTANALQYVKRELGISYGEIENMTVRDVIDMLEQPENKSLRPSKDQEGFNHSFLVKGKTLSEKIENAKKDIISAFGKDSGKRTTNVTVNFDEKKLREIVDEKAKEMQNSQTSTKSEENDSKESEPEIREGQRHNRLKAKALKLKTKI